MTNWTTAARAFSGAYCVLYVAALAFHLPAFSYFPVTGRFEFGTPDPGTQEVSMAWYGLMVTAAVGALVVAVIAPKLAARAYSGAAMWLIPTLAMVACVVLMRGFFV